MHHWVMVRRVHLCRPTKRRRGGGAFGFAAPHALSPELAAFLGRQTCPRKQVVKLLWEYIKEHQLQVR